MFSEENYEIRSEVVLKTSRIVFLLFRGEYYVKVIYRDIISSDNSEHSFTETSM
jgi:hypothetical protein